MFSVLNTGEFVQGKPKCCYDVPADDNVLWQFMRPEYFRTLLTSNQLFMRRATEYSEKDSERNFLNIIESIYPDLINDVVKEFATSERKNTYISCWYTHPEPTDHMHNAFATEGGVAISTTVGAVKSLLFDCTEGKNAILTCGPVQYISKTALHSLELFRKKHGSGYRINSIIPCYFKPTNKGDEKEFRIVYRSDPSLVPEHVQASDTPNHFGIEIHDPETFITSVAVKENPGSAQEAILGVIRDICKSRKYRLELKDSQEADGFQLFSLRRDT